MHKIWTIGMLAVVGDRSKQSILQAVRVDEQLIPGLKMVRSGFVNLPRKNPQQSAGLAELDDALVGFNK